MRDGILFSDNQTLTNLTSTGVKSTDIDDLEQNSAAVALITDDQQAFNCNFVLTSVSFTSGGTEGIILEVRTSDNSDMTTGAEVIGAKDVLLADIVAGKKFSVPVEKNVMQRYLSAWFRAKSTTYTGTIKADAYKDFAPISPNETLQKVPA